MNSIEKSLDFCPNYVQEYPLRVQMFKERPNSSCGPKNVFFQLKRYLFGVTPQRTYRGRVELLGMDLPSQLERTLQLVT